MSREGKQLLTTVFEVAMFSAAALGACMLVMAFR
jgi:hypothetical protein